MFFFDPFPIMFAMEQAAADRAKAKAIRGRLEWEKEHRAKAGADGLQALLAFERALADARVAREEREEKKRHDDLREREVRALERSARAAERIASARETVGDRLLHDWRIW